MQSLVAAIESVDAMTKAASVELVSIERRLGGRLVTVVVKGSLSDVEAAVAAGVEAGAKIGKIKAHEVIARPHPEIYKFLNL